jgi:hypothetical protein
VKQKRLAWFGVKTLYRTRAVGSPAARDRHFDPSLTLVEERVVLVRARNHAGAIRKAERQARKYAAFVTWRNPYGQRLRVRYIRACQSYKLFDPLRAGAEVYSDTFLVKKTVSDRELISSRVLPSESNTLHSRRRNFLDERFNKPAGAFYDGPAVK